MGKSWIILLPLLLSCNLGQDIHFPPASEVQQDAEVIVANLQNSQTHQYQSLNYNNFTVADKVTNLGISVHKSVRNLFPDNHFYVYSPVSLALTFYLLLLGSNGKTFTELSNLLGVDLTSNNSLKLHQKIGKILRNLESKNVEDSIVKTANGLFVQNNFPINEQYKNISENVYQSKILNLDFRGNPDDARNTINNWVYEKTLGKIDNIIPEYLSTATKLIIVSSLYFKSDWAIPFDSSLTKLHSFYPNGKQNPSKYKVNLMASVGIYRYYKDTNINCEIVGIPYKDPNIVFYLILPQNSNKNRIQNLEQTLSYNDLKVLVKKTVSKQVLVAIPKMKLTSNYQLVKVMKNLGVRTLFDPSMADLSLMWSSSEDVSLENDNKFIFSRMKNLNESNERRKRDLEDILDKTKHFRDSNSSKLFVNQILHKVMVDVNEKGTEGAAATSISTIRTSITTVKADAPFLFFIQHESTNIILFFGSVILPSPYEY